MLVLCSLLCTATSAWAEGNSIRGIVTDAKGNPVAGAQIRAERTDAKGKTVVAVSDAKGRYELNHLDVGTYKVVALINKTPGSAATVKTNSTGWVKLDFSLKGAIAAQHHIDQSLTDRIQGQDLRRMQQDQAFGH